MGGQLRHAPRGRNSTIKDVTVRIAALFLGLIAGLFALLAPSALGVDLMSPFLNFWADTTSERLLGTTLWYAIAGAALVGGVVATATPGFAAVLLLGAAAGWLGIAVSVPQLFTYHLLVPAGAAAMAAIFAFIAGELQLRQRRMARRNRRLEVADDAMGGEIERETALRMDPLMMPRSEAPTPQKRVIPLTLSDVTVMPPPAAGEAPRWQDLDPPPRRRDPDIWAEPRREAAPLAMEVPAAPDPILDVEVEVEPEVPEREPHDAKRSGRRRGGGALAAALAAVVAVLVVGVLAAGGYLLYRDGTFDALLSPNAAQVSEDVAPVVVANSEPEMVAKPAEPARIELPKLPSQPTLVAAAPEAPATAPPVRIAAVPAPVSYEDPFSYCSAVGTIDHVDYRYAGPAFTEEMTRALLIPPGSSRDRVRWRCVNGTVLACTSYFGPVCDMTPTVIEMREFCERNPNVAQLLAPNGPWSCADGKPKLPDTASWPVDARGFLPGAWVTIAGPDAPPAG